MRFNHPFMLFLLSMLFSCAVIGQSNVQQALDKSELFCEKGECDSAIYYLNSAITRNKGKGKGNENANSLADLYLHLGHSYMRITNYIEAFKAYTQAERLSVKTKNEEGLARIYISWIEYYRKRQKYAKAQDYVAKMHDLLSRSEVPLKLIGSFYSRCAAIEMEGNHDIGKSRDYSSKVLSIAKKLNDTELSATAYNEIGYSYENEQNFTRALKFYHLAEQEWEKVGNYRSLIDAVLNLSRCQTRLDNPKAALITFQRGIHLCDSFDLIEPKIALLYNLHVFYAYINDHKSALETYKTYHQALYEESITKKEKELNELERKYDLDQQIALSNQEKHRAELAEKDAKNKTYKLYTWTIFSVLLTISLIMVIFLLYRIKIKNGLLKLINKELKDSIAQKDTIFKELHHRVKNNLTLLKSILYLHSKTSSNETAKQILMDCQSRIDSMAIVHKNLYETNDVTHVKLSGFIYDLIAELENSMLPNGKRINATIEENDISIDTTHAVLLGFVINELVTNSIKYGANKNGELVVGISCNKVDDQLVFKYWDEGKGLETTEFIIQEGGFGFRLIEIMMRQLSTKMVYSIQSGKPTFEFTIISQSQ